MDEHTRREIMDRARSLLDPEKIAREEAEHEAWRAEHAAALENAEVDALCAAQPVIKQRDFNDLVYKRRDDGLVPQQKCMNAEQQVAWDAWCDGRIGAASETIARAIGEEVGVIERGLLADIDRRFNELFAAVAALRVELETLRAAHKKGKKAHAA